MGFFTRFPYTNLHDINLDWIIERVKAIDLFEDRIEAAQDAADAAQSAAETATSAATAAQKAADAAQEAAETAQESADNKILYFRNLTLSPASNATVLRIPATGSDSRITTDSVIAEFNAQHPENIRGNLAWTSYNGYVQFTGTCSGSTLCNVVIANI